MFCKRERVAFQWVVEGFPTDVCKVQGRISRDTTRAPFPQELWEIRELPFRWGKIDSCYAFGEVGPGVDVDLNTRALKGTDKYLYRCTMILAQSPQFK